MFKAITLVDNEEGSAIILAIFSLVVLSIIGFASSRMSTTEMQIVRNDGTYNKRFYIAESGAIQAAQMLENETDFLDLNTHVPDYLNPNTVDMRDTTSWVVGGANPTAVTSNLVPNNGLEVAVVDERIARGGSMRLGGTRLHELAVFGLLDRDARGQHMVEIGYRKRY